MTTVICVPIHFRKEKQSNNNKKKKPTNLSCLSVTRLYIWPQTPAFQSHKPTKKSGEVVDGGHPLWSVICLRRKQAAE